MFKWISQVTSQFFKYDSKGINQDWTIKKNNNMGFSPQTLEANPQNHCLIFSKRSTAITKRIYYNSFWGLSVTPF